MIYAIACVDKDNLAIGYQGELIYHIKEDMNLFKTMTSIGTVLIMGRKTYESVGDLPGRSIMVVSSRKKKPAYSRAEFTDIKTALFTVDLMKRVPTSRIVICGGGEIYKTFLKHCEYVFLTEVSRDGKFDIQADAYFPDEIRDESKWKKIKNPDTHYATQHGELVSYQINIYKNLNIDGEEIIKLYGGEK